MEIRNTGMMPINTSLDGPAAEMRQEARLRKAADGFEALFVQQMLKAARSASLGDGLLDNSGQEKMRDMMDQTLAETSAGSTGLGLSDAVYRQFAGQSGKKG
jgi:flagellar protein FlgJ